MQTDQNGWMSYLIEVIRYAHLPLSLVSVSAVIQGRIQHSLKEGSDK